MGALKGSKVSSVIRKPCIPNFKISINYPTIHRGNNGFNKNTVVGFFLTLTLVAFFPYVSSKSKKSNKMKKSWYWKWYIELQIDSVSALDRAGGKLWEMTF